MFVSGRLVIPSRLLVLRGWSSETVSPCAAVSACGIEIDAVPANKLSVKALQTLKAFSTERKSSCVKVCWMLGLDDAPTCFPTVWWYAFMKANVAITLL